MRLDWRRIWIVRGAEFLRLCSPRISSQTVHALLLPVYCCHYFTPLRGCELFLNYRQKFIGSRHCVCHARLNSTISGPSSGILVFASRWDRRKVFASRNWLGHRVIRRESIWWKRHRHSRLISRVETRDIKAMPHVLNINMQWWKF